MAVDFLIFDLVTKYKVWLIFILFQTNPEYVYIQSTIHYILGLKIDQDIYCFNCISILSYLKIKKLLNVKNKMNNLV